MKYYSVLRFCVLNVANFILPFYFKLTANNLNYRLEPSKKRTNKTIVSLTSFPARINKVWLVIETILHQTSRPDMIILWLSEEQFKNKEILPKNLLMLQKRGLKIELRPGDLRSHKKYYYTLLEYPNDVMITIDDDIFYKTTMIESLMKEHNKNIKTIVAQYGRKMRRDINEKLRPYNTWELVDKETISSNDFFLGSGGGTLFPPNCLHKDILNYNLFNELTYYADDVWINAMIRLSRNMITQIPNPSLILPVLIKKNKNLSTINLSENMNDKQIAAVRAYYIANRGIDPFGI
ncbi:hypothetical protein LJC52_04755 [Bacteroidales bacterium OttesenSCG-928-A17]|nr:hypothetical protein [Bacteroidales bacterium OttesenSCG-928-A17]